MKFARMIADGVIADKPEKYKRGKLLLQRVIDQGGDSVLITADGNHGERTTYIVPTGYLIQLLDEPLESED